MREVGLMPNKSDGLIEHLMSYFKKASQQDEDASSDEEKKPKYPKMWFLYDGRQTYLGNIAYDATENYSVQITKDERNVYFDEMFMIARPLGDDGKEMENSIIIPNVDKDKLEEAFKNAGFAVVEVSNRDHDELIRELDKLETVKGGESKKYK